MNNNKKIKINNKINQNTKDTNTLKKSARQQESLPWVSEKTSETGAEELWEAIHM